MTCPRCKCPECAKVELNAVLSRRVARETNLFHKPVDRQSVEMVNSQALREMREREEWRDTFEPHARRFHLPREPGKVPVDPDAEQLARDDCARTG